LRLQDYICGRLKNVAEVVRKESGSPTFNLFGYCLGGTMSTMFTALFPELVRTLTLLAAPIDFANDGSLLHALPQEQYFDVDRFVDAYGNCPAPFLQASFKLMKPVQNFVEKYTGFVENMQDEKYLENFFAMEKWGDDNIPVAGETFREFVKCLYQRNELVQGLFRLQGRKVKLERITCPLLLLTTEFDHLVTLASTLGIRPPVRSQDVKTMSVSAGHIGLAVSSKAHRQFWPQAADWIAERSTACPAH
jgi:polyhydroxyalkanoate synthase